MVEFVSITAVDDPRVADYTAIRERDLTGRGGKFIVEGKVTLAILLARSRFAVDSLFLCETRLEPLAETLSQVPGDVPVYVAPQSVVDGVAGFAVHRGVLACARKGESLDLAAVVGSQTVSSPSAPSALRAPPPLAGEASTIVVLNQISNHDNVGAAFRNAAAFGASGVVLDAGSCDPLYRKAIRVSAGASLWLPFHQGDTGEDHIAALQGDGYTVWAMTPRMGAAPLSELAVPDRLAIMLGAEGAGLPDHVISAATAVRIPMSAGFDSVNVATAGAIALAHVFNTRA